MYTILVIVIYTLLVLLFVPLDSIAKTQTTVRKKWKEVLDKINS